jgi:Tfp pilus assembly PilM family ATPase
MTRSGGPLSGLLWRRQRRFLAVDFDSRQVRIVQAELGLGGVRILKLASVEVPAGVDTGDAKALGGLLRETLGRMRLAAGPVLMCVPRGQAILKALVLPTATSASELASMVLYQAEKELTFRPNETVVDFTLESHYGAEAPPEEQGEGVQVLVAAVRQSIVEHYRAVAHAAGLKLAGLGLRPYANLRAVQAYGRRGAEARTAIIQITTDEAEIDVSDAGALTFTRPAAIKVPAPLAEPAAGDAAQTVVTEVSRSLHSYLGVERGHKVDAVLVAGGTGLESRIEAELRRRLDIPVETLDPAGALGLAAEGPSASAFISALGLAASFAPGAGLPIDFLNPKKPPVQRDRRKILAAAVAGAVVLVMAGAFAAGGVQYWAARSRLTALETEYNKLSTENKGVTVLAKRVEALDGWVHGGRDWLDHWAYLSGVFPPCKNVYVTLLKSNPDRSINLMVKANSGDALNEISRCLGANGYDFKPNQVATLADPYGYGYSETVTVITKSDMPLDLHGLRMPVRPEDDASAERFGRPTAISVSAPVPVREPVKAVTPPPTAPVKEPTKTPTIRPTAPSTGGGGTKWGGGGIRGGSGRNPGGG